MIKTNNLNLYGGQQIIDMSKKSIHRAKISIFSIDIKFSGTCLFSRRPLSVKQTKTKNCRQKMTFNVKNTKA